jgi:hypothetical protein
MTTDRAPASRTAIARGLLVAGGLLGVTVVLKLLSPDHLSPEAVRRMLGGLLGAVVVAYANAVPKALTPLMQLRCDPAAEQALRRFTGRSLVLGGASYGVTWAIAPLPYANLLAAGFLATALLLVALRFALAKSSRSRS